jgi:hypothetical protein
VAYRFNGSCVLLLAVLWTPLAASEGEPLYTRCAACHLPTGQGVPGAFPPLTERLGAFVSSPTGRSFLVMVVKVGMIGQVRIADTVFQGIMPAQILTDDEIAAVLNYVMTQFNHESLPDGWREFTGREVAETIARHAGATAHEVAELRKRVVAETAGAP